MDAELFISNIVEDLDFELSLRSGTGPEPEPPVCPPGTSCFSEPELFPPINDHLYFKKLPEGVGTRNHEPWFECEIVQRFNDHQRGTLNGFDMKYDVHYGAGIQEVNWFGVETQGKYTDACYFDVMKSELVFQSTPLSNNGVTYRKETSFRTPPWWATTNIESTNTLMTNMQNEWNNEPQPLTLSTSYNTVAVQLNEPYLDYGIYYD